MSLAIPDVYTLAALAISTALAAEAQDVISDLDGMTAVTLVAKFTYGTGGTTCVARIETSFDGGTTWIEIARFDFAQAAASKVANLSGLLSKAVTAVAALNADSVLDGVLGDRLRAKITSTGTYADTTLDIRAAVR